MTENDRRSGLSAAKAAFPLAKLASSHLLDQFNVFRNRGEVQHGQVFVIFIFYVRSQNKESQTRYPGHYTPCPAKRKPRPGSVRIADRPRTRPSGSRDHRRESKPLRRQRGKREFAKCRRGKDSEI